MASDPLPKIHVTGGRILPRAKLTASKPVGWQKTGLFTRCLNSSSIWNLKSILRFFSDYPSVKNEIILRRKSAVMSVKM
jgi:hypothetical protein